MVIHIGAKLVGRVLVGVLTALWTTLAIRNELKRQRLLDADLEQLARWQQHR